MRLLRPSPSSRETSLSPASSCKLTKLHQTHVLVDCSMLATRVQQWDLCLQKTSITMRKGCRAAGRPAWRYLSATKTGGGAPCRSGAWLKNGLNFLAAIGGESSYRLRCRSTPQDGPPYEARSHGAEFAIRGAISPLALCSGMKTKVLVCDGVDCICMPLSTKLGGQ